jgi:AraC-like DNA-binding protein
VFILLLILAREVFFAGAPWLQDSQYLATAVVLVGMNFILLGFVPGLLDPIQRTAPLEKPTPPVTASQGTETQLSPVIRMIEEQGIHREYGMTIGKLAETAGMPEYRLRQLINSGMGFRNFNDFLNSFRIREASRRLVDPREFKVPVLTIALDVGFRSISSFNKAFKEFHGMTPTAFRKQNAPDEFREKSV